MASREQGEKCQYCGSRYQTVYHVPDDVWEKIRPNKNDPNGDLHGGLLCPMCADQLARDNGITLYWEPSVDDWRENKLTAAEKERDRLAEDKRELVEALEWYADPDNYTRDSWGILSVVQAPDYGDPGATARATIDRIKAREGKGE